MPCWKFITIFKFGTRYSKLSLSTLNTKTWHMNYRPGYALALQKNLDLQFNSAKDCTIQTDVLKLNKSAPISFLTPSNIP